LYMGETALLLRPAFRGDVTGGVEGAGKLSQDKERGFTEVCAGVSEMIGTDARRCEDGM